MKKAHEHTDSVKRRFSTASPHYEQHASVQRRAAEKLVRLLPPPERVDRILEAGCGTGIFTRHLLKHYPSAAIDALDLSPSMVDVARELFGYNPRVVWHVSDVRGFSPNDRFHLIAGNCSLHWIDPLLEGLQRLTALLYAGGELTASFMLHGTLGELHEARLEVAPHKPPQGRLPRLQEIVDTLELCGCAVHEAYEETEFDPYPDAKAFLRGIHRAGFTGGDVSRASSPLTRGELEALAALYDANYPDGSGGVRASYRVGYVKAARP